MPSKETKPKKDEPKSKCSGCRCAEKSIHTMSILLIIAMILAAVGTCFGIYATIQANRALSYVEGNVISDDEELSDDVASDDEQTEETTSGVPSSKDAIESVYIVYNGGKDYIDITRDNEDGSGIDYYTYDENDEYVGNFEEVDISPILQYIMDNDIQYLGNNEYNENDSWGVEIYTADNISYIGGNDPAPDWFNSLLQELNVDQKGYKSNNS